MLAPAISTSRAALNDDLTDTTPVAPTLYRCDTRHNRRHRHHRYQGAAHEHEHARPDCTYRRRP